MGVTCVDNGGELVSLSEDEIVIHDIDHALAISIFMEDDAISISDAEFFPRVLTGSLQRLDSSSILKQAKRKSIVRKVQLHTWRPKLILKATEEENFDLTEIKMLSHNAVVNVLYELVSLEEFQLVTKF